MSDENLNDQGNDIFTQDGVLLKACSGHPMTELNISGSLCITEYANGAKIIEWKPNDLITIDSDIQDQEWSVVNTVGRRSRTLSGNYTQSDIQARARIIQLPLSQLKGFRVTRNNQQIQFSSVQGQSHSTFFFQHGNAEIFVQQLKSHLKTAKSRGDRSMYLVVEQNDEMQKMDRSFAELDIFTENPTDVVWSLVSNFKQRPYTTTMEAFSKITNTLFYVNDVSNNKPDMRDDVVDLLSKSMRDADSATLTTKQDGYEVINVKPILPPRPCIPRGTPLSAEQWEGLQDSNGRIDEVDGIKQIIFRGGIEHTIRPTVWKYLLDYYPWHMSNSARIGHQKKKIEEYFSMKLQWRSMTPGQESRFSDYQERKSLIEKDVNRTDRTMPYYAGDNNPHLAVLSDILMTYVMYNFDLGYVQGMSDLLSPILATLGNEVDSFWCFAGFLDKIASNFDINLTGMKNQLLQLNQLLGLVSPDLSRHLALKDSSNMYFCFRWMLVWFKREFGHYDILRLWEVLWTGLPCANFHLLICVAILDSEKEVMIRDDYGFTEILRHVNDLSMRLDVDKILSQAEGIYHQICATSDLTDQIRNILGLPLPERPEQAMQNDIRPSTSSNHLENGMEHTSEASRDKTDERGSRSGALFDPEAEEVLYQIGLDMNF